MLQKKNATYNIFFYSNSVYLSDKAISYSSEGDYIREKFGSVGVIYLELRAWKPG